MTGAGPSPVEVALQVLRPLGARAVPDGPIGALTTYRVGGSAALRVTVVDRDELDLVADARAASGLVVLVVGRGSNMLVSDRGFPGLAVVLDQDAFGTVAVDGPVVRAGAAVALPTLARRSVEAGLSGLEWAVGVPGSVGGAVRMNAGGHGSDTAANLLAASVTDLDAPAGDRHRRLGPAELAHGYRRSSIGPGHVVTEAEFRLEPGDTAAGRETIRQIVRWRREHQPGGQNAGSVFTNPPGDSAGRLIEATGLRGRREGTAIVSPKHANFIQADPGGSADDVHRLMQLIRRQVEAAQGVELHTEVRLIGFEAEPSSTASEFVGGAE